MFNRLIHTTPPPINYYRVFEMSMDVDANQTSIAIVGMGYVGLPTALAFHQAGFHVRGIDISDKTIDMIRSGKPPFVDEGVTFSIPVGDSRWGVYTDFKSVIPDSDIVLITVPTPVKKDKTPDLSFVKSASRSVLESIVPENETIVVLESTVYPGVTRDVMNNICSDLDIEIGNHIHIAYSPERINPGDPLHSAGSVDRIIGCDDPNIGQYLADLYSCITAANATYVGPIEVAEAAKLVENVQRDIDIAFVNELATVLPKMGVDVEKVLSAAATKWNFHRHTPGIGVGGHCIPVDPYYYIDLSEKIGNKSQISTAAREINESMPLISAREILDLTKESEENTQKILILGYSYKPETGDVRDTPVLEMSKYLADSGAHIEIWDPHVDEDNFPEWSTTITNPLKGHGYDVVVLATAHSKCVGLDWSKLLKICKSPKLYDGRRALSPELMKEIGWEYNGTGFP